MGKSKGFAWAEIASSRLSSEHSECSELKRTLYSANSRAAKVRQDLMNAQQLGRKTTRSEVSQRNQVWLNLPEWHGRA
jgi:hypothetical protein